MFENGPPGSVSELGKINLRSLAENLERSSANVPLRRLDGRATADSGMRNEPPKRTAGSSPA
jgi:hypothetical protein